MLSTKPAFARIATTRVFFSSSSKSQRRWDRRCRLLDASRGILDEPDGNSSRSSKFDISSTSKKRPLPTFPLEARHFRGYDQLGSATGSLPPNTPKEFHQSLCEMIGNAKDRIRIASLYIGPATSNKDDCEEAEMLKILSELIEQNSKKGKSNKKLSVKILLDENRALRPVPVIPTATVGKEFDQKDSKKMTSSAEAVVRALGGSSSDANSSLHLFRVLPPTTIAGKNWLPNPLDEIAGVFHIKIYIVDDQLLLSGANLSREYFRDRMDRYLHLVDGANGLVDFYAELVDILCRYSNEYNLETMEVDSDKNPLENKIQKHRIRREELLREVTQHFQDPNSSSILSARDLFAMEDNSDGTRTSKKEIVAVGVPTFQAPAGYFRHRDCPNTVATDLARAWSTFWSLFFIDRQQADKVDFVTDVDATLNILSEAGRRNNNSTGHIDGFYTAQLSSAYLNPTPSLLSILRRGFKKINLLTAGKISHGFKPKKKECNEGSQGKDWTIPSVFDKLVEECMSSLRTRSKHPSINGSDMDARLFFWERPDWTFHAKGIWLTENEIDVPHFVDSEMVYDADKSEVAAVVVGSSNFGYRSFYRDMESNLLLVFPPGSSSSSSHNGRHGNVAGTFAKEWKNLVASSKLEIAERDRGATEIDTAEKPPPLPWPILKSIPYVKTFF